MDQESFDIVRVTLSKNLKYNDLFYLFNKYGTATEILKNINEINKQFNSNIVLVEKKEVDDLFDMNIKLNINIITFKDKKYSRYLKLTECYPFVLYYKGNIDLFDKNKTVAIVGSRNTSINDIRYTEKISKEIGEYGYVVVSGLARGIDASAHRGALKTGTIAVLGNGVDFVYPQENIKLYDDILNNNGLIISEFRTLTRPQVHFFPQRNRIIAGLSKGVLIVNAGKRSGAIHTVNQALRFNREVMAFPGSPYDERHFGTNELLKNGATLVLNSKDIIEDMENTNILDELLFDDKKKNVNKKLDIINISSDECSEDDFKMGNYEQIIADDDLETLILTQLDYSPLKMNELMELLLQKYSIDKLNQVISKLELENKILVDNNNVSLRK